MSDSPRVQAGSRTLALCEVGLAFALMHVAFRAARRYTPLGSLEDACKANVTPGLVMAAIAIAFIALRRQPLSDLGLARHAAGRSAVDGLVGSLAFALVASMAFAAGMRHDPAWRSAAHGLAVGGLNLVVAAIALALLRWGARPVAAIPSWVGVAFAAALPPLAFAALAQRDTALARATGDVVSAVIVAPIAEELFFRGYMQGRLNQAFGRPWRLLGVPFGVGLVVASLAFGLIHALNPLDYFRLEGSVAWWWGVSTATTVVYGLLRERGDSVVAPIVLHMFVNAATRAVGAVGAA